MYHTDKEVICKPTTHTHTSHGHHTCTHGDTGVWEVGDREKKRDRERDAERWRERERESEQTVVIICTGQKSLCSTALFWIITA